MYHQHSQPQGPPAFSNAPRPQQLPQNQHQNHPTPSVITSQGMDFQFPPPARLPNELHSALALHGNRDMDHRPVDNKDVPNQHQGQRPGCGISQHGNYRSNPVTLNSDNHSGHQQGVDWSGYQPQSKLFISPPPHSGHVPQNPVEKPQSSHTGTRIPNWTGPAAKHLIPHSGGGDGQSLYTAESAGSILASFGLSNDDLEVLSHYPDEQLTPDTLPFILRNIQINKSGDQKSTAATSTSSFSRSIHKLPPSGPSPLVRSRSPELPSLLTVTQTAGKVIDYGHASRAKEETESRETFRREQLSSERRVKLFSSSSTPPKVNKTERQQVNLKHTNPGKHGDQDYRRTNSDHRKSSRSPGREFPPLAKSRNLDRDYRREGPKPRLSPKRRSEESLRRSVPSSDSKQHGSGKTPTLISDFSSVVPKVYPHTCSLCHIQCDQEKDWVDHSNTVNHIAACRELRNKHPDGKSDFPSRSGRYGSRALWDSRDHSPAHSRPRSYSPPKSPQSTHREGSHTNRPYRRPYSTQYHPQYRNYAGGPLHNRGKRPHDYVTKSPGDESHHPPFAKVVHSSRHEPLPSSKSAVKPRSKASKLSSTKAANSNAKPSAPEKKKKGVTAASQHSAISGRLVYLTDIPKDASEEEVTNLVGSFGKINNVILIPCSGEQSDPDEGQKASVCMVKAEDARSLAGSTELFIRQQKLTASVAKKPEGKLSSDTLNSQNSAEGKTELGVSDKNGLVLITGLPQEDWSEADIEKLVQPFGTPSHMILAKQIGKVLVYVPNKEVAEEMVKVNTSSPLKFNDCDLKMRHINQFVSLSTPVALYNLLMGSIDQSESPAQVGWSSLLVIQNVPHTSNGSAEVQKLVRRFGTVIRSLVLQTMVVCEMATAAMALSVYKRFQGFPCIIQNNPLRFSRKPDPKIGTQSKIISAPQSEDKSRDCDMETGENKSDGSKGENPPGDNVKIPPTHAKAPSAELEIPENVENLLSDECQVRAASQSNSAAASNDGEHEAAPQESKQVKVTAEAKEEVEGVKPQEREQKAKEARKESDAREHKERDRRALEKEKVPRERDRVERVRRERDRKEEKKREGERRERAKTDRKSTNAVRSSYRSQKTWRGGKQNSPSTDARRTDTEESDPFPFNMSDFVTVDEVGDVADLPLPPSPTVAMETSPEDPPTLAQKDGQTVESITVDAVPVESDDHESVCEQAPPVQVSPRDSEETAEPPGLPPVTENEPTAEFSAGAQPAVAALPEESERTSSSSAPGTEAEPNEGANGPHSTEEQDKPAQVKDTNGDVTPPEQSGEKEMDKSKSDDQSVKEKTNAASPTIDDYSLPPFNPHNPVGMEFLAPKTGFFCKACNRFFSGAKEAEMAHCKTQKHYDNVKSYLQTKKTGAASIN
ncbi:zinc finger protein 638-like [Takifugu flavidus]|uniref:Zinc finger protein 638 n=1 Tax=Takifugu flavidus TaxID=433684 RepID=A0A5C6MYK5_9TELE|nr:zinc finger protein 638-like [Takifugu flavidus]TWW59498.1 Zinc finger protein 638 [Takifugu flavidus]